MADQSFETRALAAEAGFAAAQVRVQEKSREIARLRKSLSQLARQLSEVNRTHVSNETHRSLREERNAWHDRAIAAEGRILEVKKALGIVE